MKEFHDIAISGEMVFIWCDCGERLEMSAFQKAITCPVCHQKYSVKTEFFVYQLKPDEKEIEE